MPYLHVHVLIAYVYFPRSSLHLTTEKNMFALFPSFPFDNTHRYHNYPVDSQIPHQP